MMIEPLLPDTLRQHLPAIDRPNACFDKGGFQMGLSGSRS